MVEDTMFSGESKNIEYKVSLPDKSEKYMKTIVAFANTQGGKLIVGVDDKTHQIVGVENDVLFQLMDGIANAVSDSCVPQIIPDIEPQTVEAVLVQAADAISAARPGARRESLENYIKRLEKLEEIATSFPGVEKCYAIQSGREVRIMVKPDDVTDDGTKILAKEIAKRIEKEMEYPGQIRVNVIRETRSMEYAK